MFTSLFDACLLLATGRLAIVAWIRGRLNSSLSAKAMAAHVKAIEDSSVVLLTSEWANWANHQKNVKNLKDHDIMDLKRPDQLVQE